MARLLPFLLCAFAVPPAFAWSLLSSLDPLREISVISIKRALWSSRKLVFSGAFRRPGQAALEGPPLRNPSGVQMLSYKPPVWPPRFQVNFSEENFFFFFTLVTEGAYFYDYAGGRVRIDRADGRGDRYCGSAMPGYNTPCTHLVRDGMRYLYFKEQNYCCKCCSSEKGCGVLRPTWLENATYLGHDYIFGILTTKWNMPGLQNNYYWHAMDDVPVRIYQEPITHMTFSHSSYSIPPAFNDSLFELPADMDCSPECYGTCSLV